MLTRFVRIQLAIFTIVGTIGVISMVIFYIQAPTLLLWGAKDRILPRSYAGRFAERISGKTEIRVIEGAGHLAELDQPEAVALAILDWTR